MQSAVNFPIIATSRKQIAFSRSGELSLFVAARHLSDEDWLEWLDLGPSYVREHGEPLAILNYSTGSGPNAKQRGLLAAKSEELGLSKLRCQVLLTDSVLLRGAITAMTWLIKTPAQQKAMSTKEVGAALEWLGQHVRLEPRAAIAHLNEMAGLVGIPTLSL